MWEDDDDEMSHTVSQKPRTTTTQRRTENETSASSNSPSTSTCPRVQDGVLGRPPKHPADDSAAAPQSQQHDSQQLRYVGGYSVKAPNPQKRSAIMRQGQEEEQRYQEYVERNRLKHVSGDPQPVGGPSLSLEEVRRRQQMQNSNQKMKLKEKRDQQLSLQKEKEEEEIRQKMEKAQRQAEMNEERRRRQQAEQVRLNDDEMRRQRSTFLDQLEGQNQSRGSSRESSRIAATTTPNDQLRQLKELYPQYDDGKLRYLLTTVCGNSIEGVIDLLSQP